MDEFYVERGRDAGAHRIFSPEEATAEGIIPIDDWREGVSGDWILTDDGYILECLWSGPLGKHRWIRTCHGTYRGRPPDTCTAELRECRFSFTGRKKPRPEDSKAPLDRREILFVQLWLLTADPRSSYRKAFGGEISERAVQNGLEKLFRRDRVLNYMKEHLGNALAKAGVDEKFVIEGVKKIAKIKYNPKTSKHNTLSASLRAYQLLGSLVDVFDNGNALPPGPGMGEVEDAEYETIVEALEVEGDQPQPAQIEAGELQGG